MKIWVIVCYLIFCYEELKIIFGKYYKNEIAEVDSPANKRQDWSGSKPGIERILEFGKELNSMSVRLSQEQGKNENNKKMLQVKLLWFNKK